MRAPLAVLDAAHNLHRCRPPDSSAPAALCLAGAWRSWPGGPASQHTPSPAARSGKGYPRRPSRRSSGSWGCSKPQGSSSSTAATVRVSGCGTASRTSSSLLNVFRGAPSEAIAARSLGRWPIEVTPILIRLSVVIQQDSAIDIVVAEYRRIVRARARATTPLARQFRTKRLVVLGRQLFSATYPRQAGFPRVDVPSPHWRGTLNLRPALIWHRARLFPNRRRQERDVARRLEASAAEPASVARTLSFATCGEVGLSFGTDLATTRG